MIDSIERIKEDSLKFVEQYWNCANVYTCEKCPAKIGEQKPYEHYETFSCSGAMQIDLIERTVNVMDARNRRAERTCKWKWVEKWNDITAIHELEYAGWVLDCGCYDLIELEALENVFPYWDDYDEPPCNQTGFEPRYCPHCGAKVVL